MSKLSYIAIIIFVLLFGAFYVAPVFRGQIEVVSSFHAGPVILHWYGIIIAAAILAGYLIARKVFKSLGLDPAHAAHVLPWVVIFGFVGARIYFVLFNLDFFVGNPWQMLAVHQGGLAIYGGIVGGLAGAWIYCRRAGLSVWSFWDALAVAAPVGQGIGRFGNFMNQEAFGAPANLPWGMFVEPSRRPAGYADQAFFHPAFLYESLWDFAVFLILVYLLRKHIRPGRLLAGYLIFYSLGRFFVEGLRLDSLLVETLRVNQAAAILAAAAGLLIYIYTEPNEQKENIQH